MYGINNHSPRLSMFIGDHDRNMGPVQARPIDQDAFTDDKAGTVSSSIRVVLDLSWTGLERINASVSGQCSHSESISKLQVVSKGCGLKKV